MKRSKSSHWRTQGTDPDYRFSLANERTFLAWIRTALAFLAGALILHQIGGLLHLGSMATWLCVTPACLAALLGGRAFFRWRQYESAMRMQQSLPSSSLIPILSGTLAVLSLAAALGIALAT